MSQIISNWLVTNVRLPEKFKSCELEKEFATGYMFGKLLHSLGLQDNFDSHFVNGSTVDAIIKNYTSLEVTLREKLHLRLSSSTALDLIHAKPGSTAKLLYEIKIVTDTLPVQKKRKFVKRDATGNLEGFDSYPSSPVDGRSATIQLKKEDYHPQILPFDAQAIHHFGIVLKQKLKRTNEFIPKKMAPPPLPVKKQLPPIPKIEAPSHDIATTPNTFERPKKRVFQTEDNHIDSDDDPQNLSNDFFPTKIPLKKLDSEKNTVDLLNDPMDDFEVSAKSSTLDPETIGTFLKTKASLDQSKHIRQLRKALDDSNALDPDESRQYLEKIKIQKYEIEAARKDREQNRKKIILTYKRAEEEQEEKVLEEILNSKLLRQSKQERRITEQLLQIRHEKDIMIENRLFREDQYNYIREKEYKEALERELRLFLNAQSEYRQQVDVQIDQYIEIQEAKKKIEHEKSVKFVDEKITNEIVNLALKSIEYKILYEKKEVPPKKLHEWKLLMLSNLSVNDYQEITSDKNVIPNPIIIQEPGNLIEIPSPVRVVDSDEFNDYLHFSGSWESNNEGLIKNHDALANIIDQLIISKKRPEEKIPLVPLPSVPIRMALIGKNYAGKKTISKFLAEKYNLSIIDVDELIRDAVIRADISNKRKISADHTESKRLNLTVEQLGANIQINMMQGNAPDDKHLVQLVVHAMNHEPLSSGGWILVGFPNTKNQAQLLERELSGYEDPKPSKKGDLKRTVSVKDKSGVHNTESFRNRSLIAYTDNPSDSRVGIPSSGLDAVFLLDISNETSLKRSAGQKFDPVTEEKYHIENRPPPIDKPGTLERLASVEDPAREMQQLQHHLATFNDEQEQLKSWINQFQTLHLIDTNGAIEDIKKTTLEKMKEIVSLVSKKQKSQAAKVEPKEISEDDKPRQTISYRRSSLIAGPDSGRSRDRRSSIALSDHNENEREVIAHDPPKKTAVSKEMGTILVDQWILIETTYTETMKFSFRSLRKLLQDAAIYFYETKAHFQNYLKRPDIEQELIEAFQKEYNSLEEDFRIDNDVKAEFHQRVEELRERLWEIVERRRDEAEVERIQIIDDRWIEDHSYILANLVVTMVQAEADRFFSTRQFIIDHYKDLNGLIVVESSRPPVRLPFISLAAAPPIEVGSALIAAYEAIVAHRKDVQISKDKPETPHKKEKEKGDKADKAETKADKAAAKEKNKAANKQVDTKVVAAAPVIEKEPVLLDTEQAGFADINSTIDFLLTALQSPIEVAASEPSTTTGKDKKGAIEQKDDSDKVPAEGIPLIEYEEKMLRQRVERVKARLNEMFRDLKSKTLEVYTQLDEWITARFKVEIEATKDLTVFFKEAIEAEQKLPNYILLSGEKLFLDYGTLIYEPEPEPVPEPPVEKQSPDQFTIAQLKVFTKHMQQLAPSGVIGTKVLIDYFQKALVFAGSNDHLPESFFGTEPNSVQQAISGLDPFDTGFVSWRKFWMMQSKLLPIDLTQMAELKRSLDESGTAITMEKFLNILFWFEATNTVPGQYDRAGKAKESIYDVFTNDKDEFDKCDFLLSCCCDENPQRALEKAFLVASPNNDTLVTRPQLLSVFTHFLHMPKSTQRLDTTIDSETPYPDHVLQKIFAAALGVHRVTLNDKISFSAFVEGCNKNGNQEWLQCPLFPLDDSTTSSRPSSGKHPV